MADLTPAKEITRTQLADGVVLLVDKPIGWTSFDVVNKLRNHIRNALGVRKYKLGHAGTLDPMATGLLILCGSAMTKSIHMFMGMEKAYSGTLKLWETTPSYDGETLPDAYFPEKRFEKDKLMRVVDKLSGPIKQKPPVYSAIKVEGRRLYELARAGKQVDVPQRSVEIYQFKIEDIRYPFIDFYVRCSKGTYVRSLAHDFGKGLRSGAHLVRLRRTAIGPHQIEDAWSLEELILTLDHLGK